MALLITNSSTVAIFPPHFKELLVSEVTEFDKAKVRDIVNSYRIPFNHSDSADASQKNLTNSVASVEVTEQRFIAQQCSLAIGIEECIWTQLSQGAFPDGPPYEDYWKFQEYFELNAMVDRVAAYFSDVADNRMLGNYVNDLSNQIRSLTVNTILPPKPSIAREKELPSPMPNGFISRRDMFERQAPLLPPAPSVARGDLLLTSTIAITKGNSGLVNIIQDLLRDVEFEGQKKYLEDLLDSAKHYTSLDDTGVEFEATRDAQEKVETFLEDCRKHSQEVQSAIFAAWMPSEEDVLGITWRLGAGPRTGSWHILCSLHHSNWLGIPATWKKVLLEYAASLVRYDFAQRLRRSIECPSALAKELDNIPHQELTSTTRPDDLLLELEHHITIRKDQKDISECMIATPSERSTALQLSMGKGKSTTILPSVSAALADGSRLVRIFVRREQLSEMIELFRGRFGGLIGRRVYTVPFSRGLKLTVLGLEKLLEMCQQWMDVGDVMLMLPEHAQSLRLLVLERELAGDEAISQRLSQLEQFFLDNSRDVMDEVDELLSPHLQYVYPFGPQHPVELCPQRWHFIYRILEAVAEVAPHVQKKWPESMEISYHGKALYPTVAILQQEGAQTLMHSVAEHLRPLLVQICGTFGRGPFQGADD
jgi:hypothetical protein